MAKLGILGAGAWGLSVAIKLVNQGHQVLVWAHSETSVNTLRSQHQSERLQGIQIPESISFTNSLEDIATHAEVIVIAVASAYLEDLMARLPQIPAQVPMVVLTKGLLEQEDSIFISDLYHKQFPNRTYAVLSGPNIALEIAQGKPAASVLACDDNAQAERLQSIFSGDNFRIYRSNDVRGVECGGIFKNVIAIAAGMCDGLRCGDNAKSALMTRALGEMQRLCDFFGGNPETIIGLSGLGDLMTTCLSQHSRNRRFGEACVQADATGRESFMASNTVEGQRTIKLLANRHPELLQECPIMTAVYNVLYEQLEPPDAIQQLMGRDLISESDEN